MEAIPRSVEGCKPTSALGTVFTCTGPACASKGFVSARPFQPTARPPCRASWYGMGCSMVCSLAVRGAGRASHGRWAQGVRRSAHASCRSLMVGSTRFTRSAPVSALPPASVECDGTGAGAQVACGCSSLASHRGTAEPSRHRAAIVQLVAHDGDRAGEKHRDYADGSADAVSRGRQVGVVVGSRPPASRSASGSASGVGEATGIGRARVFWRT